MLKGFWILVGLALAPLVVMAQSVTDQIQFNVSEYQIVGDNPLGDKATAVLQPFVGEQFGLAGLSAAADALESALKKGGYSFHQVSLPPQDLNTGVVRLEIVQFVIGTIDISGNEHFDLDNIRHSVPSLVEGEAPNTSELSLGLKLANRHPSKNLQLKFKQGEAPDTIDAKLTVQDLPATAFFVTLDNSGSPDSEEWRTTLGYQHGNLLNRDHSLTATLTTAPADVDSTLQLGLSYHIPLYTQLASLDLLFSNSEVNSGTVGGGIEVSGKGSVLAAIYNKSLMADDIDHGFSLGVQYKDFDNEITIGNVPSTTRVISFPLELGYQFSALERDSSWSGGLKLAVNIPSGGDNDEDAYQAARSADASEQWYWIRYNLNYDQQFAEGWLFHFGLSGQASDDLLISGEQFGVGGSQQLRGFEERSVTGDAGHYFSFEVTSPPLTTQNIRVVMFSDHASVEYNDGDSTDVSSLGFGARWSWKQNLSLNLLYGHIIDGVDDDTLDYNNDDDDRAHFNLVYRF